MQLQTLAESTVKKLLAYCRSLCTITEALRNLEVRNHLCEVYKLAKLIMVLRATNSTSEGTPSLLKLINTYLGSTMTQSRLNHLMILSAYRNRLDKMDLRKVASIFVQKMTVTNMHSVNSNFVDVVYFKNLKRSEFLKSPKGNPR